MKLSFIKPLNYLTLIAITVLVLLNSCNKQKDDLKRNSPENFFGITNDIHPILKRIADTIKQQNIRANFLSRIVREEGVAVWSKADILTGMKVAGYEGQDTTVIVPLILENSHYVNSFLVCKVTVSDVTINLIQGRYYHHYGFNKKTGYPDADWVASMIMYCDNKVFGTKSFLISDNRLFDGKKTSSFEKEINASALTLPPKPPIVIVPDPTPCVSIVYIGTSGSANGKIDPLCTPIFITVTDFPGSSTSAGGTGYYAPGGSNGGNSSTYSNWPNGVCTNVTNPSPPPPGSMYPPPCSSFMPVTSTTLTNFYDPNNPFKDLNNPINVPDGPYLYNGIGIADVPAGTPGGTSRLIGTTTNRNNVEDLTYGTNGDASGVVSGELVKTNQQLFTGMSSLFWQSSVFSSDLRSVGDLMIEKFKTNTSNTNIFTNETLNNYVSNSATIATYFKDFGNRLKSELIKANGNINNVGAITMGNTRPIFNGAYNKFHGLQILVNDTELTEIRLDRYELSATKTWEADITVTIYDHFGLDKNDVLTYQYWHLGFASWWVLQHKKGFVPFKTKIVFKKRLSGNLIP